MDCDNCAWAVAELEQQLEELRSKCRPIEIKYAEDGTPLNVPRNERLLLWEEGTTKPIVGCLWGNRYIFDCDAFFGYPITHFMELPKL
jgi:hypothetical protein